MCQARRRLLRSMKKFARKQTLSIYVPLLINGFAKNLLVMLDVELCNNKLNDRGDIENECSSFCKSKILDLIKNYHTKRKKDS